MGKKRTHQDLRADVCTFLSNKSDYVLNDGESLNDKVCEIKTVLYYLLFKISYFSKVQALVQSGTSTNVDDSDVYNDYVATQRRADEYGDSITLLALSTMLQVTIFVLNSSSLRSDVGHHVQCPFNRSLSECSSLPILTIAQIGQDHYISLANEDDVHAATVPNVVKDYVACELLPTNERQTIIAALTSNSGPTTPIPKATRSSSSSSSKSAKKLS